VCFPGLQYIICSTPSRFSCIAVHHRFYSQSVLLDCSTSYVLLPVGSPGLQYIICSTPSRFSWIAVRHRFYSQSIQIKDCEIGVCCFFAKQSTFIREQTDRLGIRTMCLCGATCQSGDCCCNELALKISKWACWSSTMRTSSSSSSFWIVTCSHHDISEILLTSRQSLTHCL
jgi:hypothetical protein